MAFDKRFIQKIFSKDRTQKYFDRHTDEQKAVRHYYANLYLSEAFYPLLSVFEVALRNSLNRELTTQFQTDEWFRGFRNLGLTDLHRKVKQAESFIAKRGEAISASKIVAELTLGFWVQLLNVEYEMVLWHDLRRAFPFMDKRIRQRSKVSAPLNKIRDFRNRVYHNEPIAWNLSHLESMRNEIYQVLQWVNRDLPIFIQPYDRLEIAFSQAKIDLK